MCENKEGLGLISAVLIKIERVFVKRWVLPQTSDRKEWQQQKRNTVFLSHFASDLSDNAGSETVISSLITGEASSTSMMPATSIMSHVDPPRLNCLKPT